MSNRFGLITKEQQDEIDKVINEKNKLYMKAAKLQRELTVARNEIKHLKRRLISANKKYQSLLNDSFKKE